MDVAGFVLAGGRSSRMGRDKALLPYRGTVLLDWIARQVSQAAGSAVIVGHPDRYGALGWPVIADLRPDCGPLAGIEAALEHSRADLNLIVACDLPGLAAPLLAELLEQAARRDCDCLLPISPSGPKVALCGVWRRRTLRDVRWCLDRDLRSLAALYCRLTLDLLSVEDGVWQANVNTPEDWRNFLSTKPHD